jgi:hypothetical protein
MGFDCTFHLVDESAVRERLVGRLLGRSHERERFDDRRDAVAIWERARSEILQGPKERAARAACELAVLVSSAALPHHYERGFALSLWPTIYGPLPSDLVGSPEALFAELVAARPELAGHFPRFFDGNYQTGVYVPSSRVADAARYVAEITRGAAIAEGLLTVLRAAARRGLAVWEATDLGVTQTSPEILWEESSPSARDVRSWDLPADPIGWSPNENGWLFAASIFPRSTMVIDLHAWPPAHSYLSDEQFLSIAPTHEGWWVGSFVRGEDALRLHAPGRAGKHVRSLAWPEGHERLHGLARLGDRIVLRPESASRPPLWFDGERFEALEGLPELARGSTAFGAVELADGTPLLIWNHDAYELRDGRFSRWELAISRKPFRFSYAPWGDDGFYYISGERLFRVRRGRPPERVLEKLEGIGTVEAAPGGALVLWIAESGGGAKSLIGAYAEPDRAHYVPLTRADVGARPGETIRGVHYGPGHEHLFVLGEKRLITVPVAMLLARRWKKAGALPRSLRSASVPPALRDVLELIESKLDDGSVEAMDTIARLAREHADPAIYDHLLAGTKYTARPEESVLGSKRSREVDLAPGKVLRPTPENRLRRSGLARRLVADAPPGCAVAKKLRGTVETFALRAFDLDLKHDRGDFGKAPLIASAHTIDLEPLTAFANLRELSLDRRTREEGVPSHAAVKWRNLDALGRLPALRVLRLGSLGHEFHDLRFLDGASSLEELTVERDLRSLEGIAAHPHLRALSCTCADISALREHPSLVSLELGASAGTDLSVLRTLPSLERLCLSGSFTGIELLRGLRVRTLDLSSRSLTTLDGLALPELTHLTLRCQELTTLGDAELPSLTTLTVWFCRKLKGLEKLPSSVTATVL